MGLTASVCRARWAVYGDGHDKDQKTETGLFIRFRFDGRIYENHQYAKASIKGRAKGSTTRVNRCLDERLCVSPSYHLEARSFLPKNTVPLEHLWVRV